MFMFTVTPESRGGGGWSWSSIQEEEEEGTEWHFPLASGKACDEMTGSLNFGVRVKSFALPVRL